MEMYDGTRCEISDFHSDEDSSHGLLDYDAV
jgi:hypothetical protein